MDSKPRKWGIWVLFSSVSTLICCALPILLVTLGMGSVAAAIYGEYLPWLNWFGRYDYAIFGITALILAVSGWALYRPGRTCPADPELAAACNTAHRWNTRFLWIAVAVWITGAFATYVLPAIYVSTV